MEKKSGNVEKKRGRPSKTNNPSSSSLETEPRTKKAAPSSSQPRDVNGHCLETLIQELLFDSGLVDNAIIPAQDVSEDTPPSHESADLGTVIVASPGDKTMTSFAVSEAVSKPKDILVKVEGYEVEGKVAPLLRAIFNKYGDIASECLFSMESRPWLLRAVCNIYKKLEASDFTHLTQVKLNSLKAQIKDLESLKMNIGWLHKRLDQVYKALEMSLNGGVALNIIVEEKKATVRKAEEEVHKAEAKLQQERDELEELQICSCGSLVNGLV